MKNAEEIFHNLDKVLEATKEEMVLYWTKVHIEEHDVYLANRLIFHRMHELTGDKRFVELEEEYKKKYHYLVNERAQFLQSFVKED